MPLPLLGAVMGGALATAGKMGAMGAGAMARGAGAGAGQLVGGASRVMKSAGKSPDEKKGMKALIDGPKRMFKQGQGMMKMAQKQMGVSFTVAGMLKQSQLFTGFLGAIFQVVGALIDAFLAPMMPTMFKLITWMARGVPHAAAMGQKVADWLGAFFRAGFSEKIQMIKDLAIKAISKLLDLLLEGVKSAFGILFSGEFWGTILSGAWEIGKAWFELQWAIFGEIFGFLGGLVSALWDKMKEKMPWLETIENFITNFVSNLTEGFKAGWDGFKNWLGGMWDRFMLLWDKFKLIFFKGIHMIPGVSMEGSIATAQKAINDRERQMQQKGMDVKVTVFKDGHRLPIDGGSDGFDISGAVLDGVGDAVGSVASKFKFW